MKRPALIVLVSVNAVLGGGCAAPRITTGRFVQELTDLPRLAEFPAPAYKTVQFSSYDRASRVPGGPGWFANADGFGGETTPGFEATLGEPVSGHPGEYLICDIHGPGAIVRTWTAGMAGNIRLFLDDARRPLYDGPAEAFLQSPYRALSASLGISPPLEGDILRQQQAAYCPIPFARRCRMIWIGNIADLHFYHVQLRRYEPGTAIQTFVPEDLRTFANEIQNAVCVLNDPDGAYPYASRRAPMPIQVTIPPREQAEALALDGPQAVERLTLKVEADDLDRALRQTILHIRYDGYPWGQVQAPLGDFFGAAPGINPYNSLPFSVSPDGTMTCRYFMPFATSLRLTLENRGEQPVTVRGSALTTDHQWNEQSLYFVARWRVNHDLLASPKAPQDMPFVMAHGTGRYVGTALMLLNPCRVPTPHGGWWGEGDEKVFVDDDVSPSTFGTGSEDYFNYAWSVPDIFAYAYCGQPRNDGYGNRGFVTNYRWQIVDDLPFRDFLAFFMELYPHTPVPGLSYARIGYYYARPGSIDDHVAITDADVRMPELPPTWQPAATHGMNRAVYFETEDVLQPGPQVTRETDPLRTGGQMIVWRPAQRGETLTLRLQVPEAGKYRLHLGLALTPSSGRVSTLLDGQGLAWGDAGGIDLYDPYRKLARQFTTDMPELSAGAHTLTIVFDGAPDAVRQPAIGVDYLAAQPR